MKSLLSCPFLGLFLFAVTQSPLAHAQGLFSGTKGARAAGRAGAFVAKADDLYAVDYNPAGLASIDGWVVHVSDRISYNQTIFDRLPAFYGSEADEANRVYFNRVENETPWQALDPFLSVGADFGLKDWGFALSAYAPPGTARMNFDPAGQLPEDRPLGAGRYMMTHREAEILTYSLSAAYKYKDLFGLGLSAQWMHVPRLDYAVVVSPVNSAFTSKNAVRGSNDALSTVTGSDPFVPNLIVGGWIKPTQFLEAGLSASIPLGQIITSSTMSLRRMGSNAEIDLTRNGVPADDVRVVIPLPMIFRLGVRYVKKQAQKELWDVELDVSYQTWSKVKNFTVDSNNLVGTDSGVAIPVGVVEIAKQWKDSFTVALGGDVNILPDRLTLRGGLGYESAVSDPAYQQIDFPTGQHLNFALGASVLFGAVEIALSYGYRHMLTVRVPEGQGRVYQQAPQPVTLGLCPAPYTATDCPYPGQPSATVNEGKYQSFSSQLSLDGIFRF